MTKLTLSDQYDNVRCPFPYTCICIHLSVYNILGKSIHPLNPQNICRQNHVFIYLFCYKIVLAESCMLTEHNITPLTNEITKLLLHIYMCQPLIEILDLKDFFFPISAIDIPSRFICLAQIQITYCIINLLNF